MKSQNDWPVATSSANLEPLPWITGRVMPGSVWIVFDHLCHRFDAEVEPITPAHSWGYAYRAIRGRANGYSNHASGTAIDLNAPDHGLGERGTFTRVQVEAIRRILDDLDGVVRWGGDYTGRADEMHFEINAWPAAVAAVAAKIRNQEDAELERPEVPTTLDLIRALDTLRERARVPWMRRRLWRGRMTIRLLYHGDGTQEQISALPDHPTVLDVIRGIDRLRATASVPWMRGLLWSARRTIRPLYQE